MPLYVDMRFRHRGQPMGHAVCNAKIDIDTSQVLSLPLADQAMHWLTWHTARAVPDLLLSPALNATKRCPAPLVSSRQCRVKTGDPDLGGGAYLVVERVPQRGLGPVGGDSQLAGALPQPPRLSALPQPLPQVRHLLQVPAGFAAYLVSSARNQRGRSQIGLL